MVRLPKHKLPKEKPTKVAQTIKHKRSEKALAKKAKKEEKMNAMETDSVVSTAPKYANEEEREKARQERKKLNKHRILYKQVITSHTGKNGPRAING